MSPAFPRGVVHIKTEGAPNIQVIVGGPGVSESAIAAALSAAAVAGVLASALLRLSDESPRDCTVDNDRCPT